MGRQPVQFRALCLFRRPVRLDHPGGIEVARGQFLALQLDVRPNGCRVRADVAVLAGGALAVDAPTLDGEQGVVAIRAPAHAVDWRAVAPKAAREHGERVALRNGLGPSQLTRLCLCHGWFLPNRYPALKRPTMNIYLQRLYLISRQMSSTSLSIRVLLWYTYGRD